MVSRSEYDLQMAGKHRGNLKRRVHQEKCYLNKETIGFKQRSFRFDHLKW